MSGTPPKKKEKTETFSAKKHSVASPVHHYESGNRHIRTDNPESKKRLVCVPVDESERTVIYSRMSRESINISKGTRWGERGFVPSFKSTDKMLMKAARRIYRSHGSDNR